jgi:hypothetical protein
VADICRIEQRQAVGRCDPNSRNGVVWLPTWTTSLGRLEEAVFQEGGPLLSSPCGERGLLASSYVATMLVSPAGGTIGERPGFEETATSRRQTLIAATSMFVAVALVGCGSSSGASTSRARTSVPNISHAPAGTAAPAAPPSGAPPGGSSTPTYSDTGAYTLSAGRSTSRKRSFKASGADESGVLVRSSGRLTLIDPTVRTTGSSKSSDESSFYGLDAGVLAESSGLLGITGGTVLTTGAGANGVFAYGSGATVTLRNVKIKATGQYAHGVMASGAGTMSVTGGTVSTAGASSAAVATDRGGGRITVNGGSFRTSGFKSPGIYSTGTIRVTGAAMNATGAEAAVVEGANSITVTQHAAWRGRRRAWGDALQQHVRRRERRDRAAVS